MSLNLDAMESGAKRINEANGPNEISRDILALVAEVRKLRGILDHVREVDKFHAEREWREAQDDGE